MFTSESNMNLTDQTACDRVRNLLKIILPNTLENC